jgi:hypothetical protein
MKLNHIGLIMIFGGFILMFFVPIQWFGWFISMAGFALIIYNYFSVRNQEKQDREAWKNKLLEYASDHKFNINHHLFNQRRTLLFIVDNEINSIIFVQIDPDTDVISHEQYDFDDIVEAHISEDDISVIKTSRGSQIGGALVGGAIAGGVGAIIGGLSGTKTQSSKIKKISLDIVVNNLNDPLKRIVVFEHTSPVSKDNSELIKIRELAERWFSLVKLIINKKDLVKEN